MPETTTHSFDGSAWSCQEALLTPVWAGGAHSRPLPLVDGDWSISTPSRQPILLAVLERSLGREALVVRITVDGGSRQLVFAPYTPAGARLLAYRPPTVDDLAGPFTVGAEVFRLSAPDALAPYPEPSGPALDDDEAAEWIGGELREGLLGRILYLADIEKQRARAMARRIAAQRHLALAEAGALDDLGRDLAVPRLPDREETDDAYRDRLAIYHRFDLPTPAGLERMLNGPGEATDPNRGLPARVGVTDRFRVVERDNPLAVALLPIACGGGGPAIRHGIEDLMRAVWLLDLDDDPPPTMPAARRARWIATRDDIRSHYERPDPAASRHLAPLLAQGLARVARAFVDSGVSSPLRLLRGFAPEAGSRGALGQGALVAPLPEAQRTELIDALATRREAGDPEATHLLREVDPDDSIAAWLYRACGLRTAVAAWDAVHVSPLPDLGLVLDGPAQLAQGERGSVRAVQSAPGAPGLHVVAAEVDAAARALLAREDLGELPPLQTGPARDAVIAELVDHGGPPPPELADLAAAGLIADDAASRAESLAGTDLGTRTTIYRLPRATLEGWASADGGGLVAALQRRADALTDAGYHALLGLWRADTEELVLVAAIAGLPGAPGLPGRPPAVAHRWYITEFGSRIHGQQPPLRIVARDRERIEVEAVRDGLAVLACVAYSRVGHSDPYEFRIGLPDDSEDALLDAEQYGYLMNLLEAWYPIGIEVNTFDIRKRHVDHDGDGRAEWLTSDASRTFHRYRRRRSASRADRR